MFPSILRCNIGVIEVFIPVTTRVVSICMNEHVATRERPPTTCEGKSTNYSNKCEIQHYHTPKYIFNVCTLKINYGEGVLVVITVQLNVDIFPMRNSEI